MDSGAFRRTAVGLNLVMTVVLTIMTGPVMAQDLIWSTNYGGAFTEEGYSGTRTPDNGYLALGSTYSYGAGDHDIYVVCVDSLGDTLWTETYGGTGTEHGYDIQATTDSGYVITGSSWSYGAGKSDIYVLKINQYGMVQWSKTIGGPEKEVGRSIRLTSDGGYIVCGSSSSFGAGFDDVYLVRLNSVGDTVWTHTYGGGSGEIGYAVRVLPDGGFVMCGATGSFGSGYSSMYVLRTDANGDTLWTQAFGGNSADMGYSVELALDGGLIFVGATASSGAGEYDIYLVKTDPSGNIEWENTYGGAAEDRGFSVLPSSDGGFLVGGTTASFGSGQFDIYCAKVNPVGDVEWERTFGGSRSEFCQSILSDQQSYVLIGYSYSYSAGGADLYLAKIVGDQATPAEDDPDFNLPEDFELAQNYPNPFNPSTTIQFNLPRRAETALTIYNVLGQPVRQWEFGSLSAGPHDIIWDGRNNQGQMSASGVYLYVLRSDNRYHSRKMVLIK